MPKKTKQRQRQKQRQSLSNIIKIAIGNRRREKKEREPRLIQPKIQTPIFIPQTPIYTNPQQPSSSALYERDRELMKTRLDLLQSQLEGKILESVNRLQEPTFKRMRMVGPTSDDLLKPLPLGEELPSSESLFGEDVPPYTPMKLSGGAYKPSLPPIFESGSGGGSETPKATPPKTTPGSMFDTSTDAMKRYIIENIANIPLVKGVTREKPYTKKEIQDMKDRGRIKVIYDATKSSMEGMKPKAK